MQKTLLYTLLLASATLGAQDTLYVAPGGTGDGSSWDEANADLAAVLAAAESGDEVWVAEGTYTPTTCMTCGGTNLDQSFRLPRGVKLYGGFAGTETSVADRLGEADSTILSGRINPTDTLELSRTLLAIESPDQETLVSGFALRHADATNLSLGNEDRAGSGGLMYVTALANGGAFSLRVEDCGFSRGRAAGYGGAVFVNGTFNRDASVTFERCRFVDNNARRGGGAIGTSANFDGRVTAILRDCAFEKNRAETDGGGALYVQSSEGGVATHQLRSTTFSDNFTLDGPGGAVRSVSRNNGASYLIVAGSEFERNAGSFGGAIQMDGSNMGEASLDTDATRFVGNTSTKDGGAVQLFAPFDGIADYFAHDTYFDANASTESGGAVHLNVVEGSSVQIIENSTFARNAAGLFGGGLYAFAKTGESDTRLQQTTFYGNRAAAAGAVYLNGSVSGRSDAEIVNCAFVNNAAGVGGAVYGDADDMGASTPFIVNSVFQGNASPTHPNVHNVAATPRITNSAFDEGACASLLEGAGATAAGCTGGNLFGIGEVFADTAGLDFSPVLDGVIVDAGLDSARLGTTDLFDANDEFRFRGRAIDMGPVEFLDADILLRETSLPDTSRLCSGESLALTATLYPEYIGAEYRWTVDGATRPENGLALTDQAPTAASTYALTVAVAGEAVSFETYVDIAPAESASVNPSAANPDTSCTGTPVALAVDVPASSDGIDVFWLDANQDTVGRGPVFTYTPDSAGLTRFTALAVFSARCAAPASATTSVNVDVKSCISNTEANPTLVRVLAYPNPATDRIAVAVPDLTGSQRYQVRDRLGRLVKSGMVDAPQVLIDLGGLMPGVHAITLSGDNNSYQAFFFKM